MGSFRIEYVIQRAPSWEGEYEEVGFGSSGGWNTIDAALYAVQSDIQNRQWETEPGMPSPEEAEGSWWPRVEER